MAQEVGYYDNDVTFTEGPFVICRMGPPGGPITGWRIEAEMKGNLCPVIPDYSIYQVERMLGMTSGTTDRNLAVKVCDELNQMVRNGQIILDPKYGKSWILNPASATIAAVAAVAN